MNRETKKEFIKFDAGFFLHIWFAHNLTYTQNTNWIANCKLTSIIESLRLSYSVLSFNF